LLGEQDIDETDPGMNQSKNAEEEGSTRLERGRNYFNAAQHEANRLAARFNWHLRTVPGVGHADARMLGTAAQDFSENRDAPKCLNDYLMSSKSRQ